MPPSLEFQHREDYRVNRRMGKHFANNREDVESDREDNEGDTEGD